MNQRILTSTIPPLLYMRICVVRCLCIRRKFYSTLHTVHMAVQKISWLHRRWRRWPKALFLMPPWPRANASVSIYRYKQQLSAPHPKVALFVESPHFERLNLMRHDVSHRGGSEAMGQTQDVHLLFVYKNALFLIVIFFRSSDHWLQNFYLSLYT